MSYALIKVVEGDLVPPVIYTQHQILLMNLPSAIGVICIDLVGNFGFLLLFLKLVEYRIKNNFRKILIASIAGLVLGLLIDLISIFLLFKVIGRLFDPLIELSGIETLPDVIIPILLFLISFPMLYGAYYEISKHLLKVDKKKIRILSVLMAIFTNPVWFTFINGILFTNYGVYFTQPKKILGDCRGTILSQCYSCFQVDWSEELALPSSIEECMKLYSPKLNLTMPQKINCKTIRPFCERLGFEEPQK